MFGSCLLIKCQTWYLEIMRRRCCLIWKTFIRSFDLNIGLKYEEKLRAQDESSKGMDPLLKRKMHCFIIFFVSDPCITEDWSIYSILAPKNKRNCVFGYYNKNNVFRYFPFFLQNVSGKFVWKGVQFCNLTKYHLDICAMWQ